MLAGIVGAICALIAIVSVKIVKARRTRAMDRAMRDYVRAPTEVPVSSWISKPVPKDATHPRALRSETVLITEDPTRSKYPCALRLIAAARI